MDISFEDGRGTSSRAQVEGLDHRERAGLKSIIGSVQKKDIHIPWNRKKVSTLFKEHIMVKVIRLYLFPQDDIYLLMSMWSNIWGLQTNVKTP